MTSLEPILLFLLTVVASGLGWALVRIFRKLDEMDVRLNTIDDNTTTFTRKKKK